MREFRTIGVPPSEAWIVQMRMQSNHHWKDWMVVSNRDSVSNKESAVACCEIANLLFMAFPCLKCRRRFLQDLTDAFKATAPPSETPADE